MGKPPDEILAETCECRFGPTGKETTMCKFHILLTNTLIRTEKALNELVEAIHADIRQTGPFKITPSAALKAALLKARTVRH